MNFDNAPKKAAYNLRVAKEGLPVAKYRTFAQGLGDGRRAVTSLTSQQADILGALDALSGGC